MEKKTTGRGLEDISNIFLSSNKKAEKKKISGLSAVTLRTNTTCHSCVNMIEGSARELKCRLFTLENEKHGVPYLATIDPSYANYCENYEPEVLPSTPPSAPFRNQVEPSTSTSGPNAVDIKELATIISEMDQDYSEMEETLTIHKKISYPNADTSPEKLQKALSKFIENGYRINSVDLVRQSETSKPKGKEVTEERVSLFIKK